MTVVAENILKQVEALPEEERDNLLLGLVSKAGPTFSSKIRPLLDDEAKRQQWESKIASRIQDMDSGKVKGISHDEVMRRLQKQLANG